MDEPDRSDGKFCFVFVFFSPSWSASRISQQISEFEKGIYNQFSVCSKADIQTVIDFFSFSGFHPLIGVKARCLETIPCIKVL